MALTVNELAQQLYVDPGDVRAILRTLTTEPVTDLVPEGLGGEVRMILDKNGERTVPQLWNQADMDTWREETGRRKPDGNLHLPGVHGALPANDDPMA